MPKKKKQKKRVKNSVVVKKTRGAVNAVNVVIDNRKLTRRPRDRK
eukprot:SAG11_NODE_43920_length_160_cov_66.032787_1_plen_44_part_10